MTPSTIAKEWLQEMSKETNPPTMSDIGHVLAFAAHLEEQEKNPTIVVNHCPHLVHHENCSKPKPEVVDELDEKASFGSDQIIFVHENRHKINELVKVVNRLVANQK